jgi:O-antigen chain-terminating methyltransferase
MSDQFYRAFEDKFRGTRALIQKRLEVYLPFVKPLHQAHPSALMLDLGCGRGEWLELLQAHQMAALGVDLDAGMLDACLKKNLHVHCQDALAYLKELPSDTAAVISAFHLVEHLSFDRLKELVAEAHRVLKSGGLLIMETPNPENFLVATQNFYLDPTHVRPIPPDLLAFVPEFFGFESVKVLRLQEAPEVLTQANLSVLEVLTGASPDYAVVSQKAGHPGLKHDLQALFDKAFGISGHALLERHRQQTHDAQFQLDRSMSQVRLSAQKAEVLANQFQSNLNRLSDAVSGVQQMQHVIQQNHSPKYKGVVGWFVLQTLRLAEQGVWARVRALVLKVLRLLLSPVVIVIKSNPALKLKMIKLAQAVHLDVFLRKLWANHSMSDEMTSATANEQPITEVSMSKNAQKIAQTFQHHKTP